MPSIQPIATTRVTDQMTRGRLTAQIQSDQLDLFKLQNQLSTGQRIFLPSDDPAAAQRVMALQRTIERKEQSLTNLGGAKSSLATTDAALRGVSESLVNLKSLALGAVDSIASEGDRLASIQAIDELFDSLVRVGNSTFTANYLLGGSERAAPPFARQSDGFYVDYFGDESSPQTYVDIGQLFDTGVSGDEVFGGLSEAVRGSADLNAQLTPETRLDQLNGGIGISAGGSIELTYVPTASGEPTESVIIDLSQAKTIDDVASLIERNSPATAGVVVTTRDGGLQIDVAGGQITVGEVANGRTARELGILSVGTPSATINGADLDPTLRLTTRIDELVGARASGRIEFDGDNNDIVLTANANGADLNDITVRFEDTGTVGSESATFVPGAPGVLTVSIEAGASTAQQIVDAINAEATGAFTAEADSRDQTTFDERGSGVPDASIVGDFTNVTAGGVDGDIDLVSGLQITNGNGTEVIDTSGVETVEDLLSLLNDPQYGLQAAINRSGDGIDVRSRRSGTSFTIGENGGTTATDLGIRSYDGSSRLADFNRGLGVVVTQFTELPGETLTSTERDEQIREQNRFTIEGQDQGIAFSFEIDPIGLTTVDDVIQRISDDTGGLFTAELATDGNGLVLRRNDAAVDPAAQSAGTVSLIGGDLAITADSPGAAGNTAFNIEVVDTGAGNLQTTFDSDTNTILVNLGGDTPDTTAVASAISGAVPGYTVTTSGPVGNVSVTPAVTATTTGGYDADSFTISGQFAERLGFIESGEESVTVAGETIQSTDNKPEEVEGVFTTLARMREALINDDKEALGREINKLDEDIDRVAFGRAEVGVRLRNLDSIAERLADEDITLRDALSQQLDADLVEVISDFTAKQAALQASLQTSGALLNLSILDFI